MKRLLKILVVLVVLGAAGASGYLFWQKKQASMATQDSAPPPAAPEANAPAATPPANPAAPAAPNAAAPAASYDLTVQPDGMSKAVATMTLQNGSTVKLRFYTNEAPNTAKRIAELISKGFYNGIKFHRVVKEPVPFVVQAGDPTGTGAGGSGVKLAPEFNAHKHELGIWSMARTEDPNSADSQFFIMLGAAPSLDGKYTVFGKVVEGIENVQKINQGDVIKSFTIQ